MMGRQHPEPAPPRRDRAPFLARRGPPQRVCKQHHQRLWHASLGRSWWRRERLLQAQCCAIYVPGPCAVQYLRRLEKVLPTAMLSLSVCVCGGGPKLSSNSLIVLSCRLLRRQVPGAGHNPFRRPLRAKAQHHQGQHSVWWAAESRT